MPDAFAGNGLEFALAYTAVRAAHVTLFLLASREDRGLRSSVLGLSAGTAAACVLLIVGALLDTGPQVALWTLALALDMGEPYFASAASWRLVPEHFAERHGLIVLVALGRRSWRSALPPTWASMFGVAVGGRPRDRVWVSELWWIYFDVVAIANVRRREARRRDRSRTPWRATCTRTSTSRSSRGS